MTSAELSRILGKTGTLTTQDGFVLRVVIQDGRTAYGREDLLVTDTAGLSEPRWVSAERVKLDG